MEGIFILKIIGDTNAKILTNNPQVETENILLQYSDKGYPFSKVHLFSSSLNGDTVILVYKLDKGNIYIVKSITFNGFYTKSGIYKLYLKKFINKPIKLKNIKQELSYLDNYYGFTSDLKIHQNFIEIYNKNQIVEALGGITFYQNISGNLHFKYDFFIFEYKLDYLKLAFSLPISINVPNYLGLAYYKVINDLNFESYLKILDYTFGARILNYKGGLFLGYKGVRIDAIDYRYKLIFDFNYKFINFQGSINELDTIVLGGSANIMGYSGNSIRASNYLLFSIMPAFKFIIPAFQIYWVDKSKTLYSYGIGIGNEHFKLFIMKSKNMNPYLHILIKS